jgi:hypothetical protein
MARRCVLLVGAGADPSRMEVPLLSYHAARVRYLVELAMSWLMEVVVYISLASQWFSDGLDLRSLLC